MSRSARLCASAAALVVAAGCEGGAGQRAPAGRVAGLQLVAAPRTVTALCRRAGQPGGPPVYGGPRHPVPFPSYRTSPPRFPIRCPTRLPAGAEAGQNLAKGRTAYQWEVHFPAGVSARRYGAAHAVLGGQQSPFATSAAPGAAWPLAGARGAASELRWPAGLTVAARASVGVRPALALRFPGPCGAGGGPNGGHLGLIFNVAGHGYFVTVHFDRLADRARVRLASSIAESLERQLPVPAP